MTAGEGTSAPKGAFRATTTAALVASAWRRRFVSFAGGAAGVLALPPFDLLPFVFVAFTALTLALDGAVKPAAPARRRLAAGASVGWWFGFGFFLAGLWWVGAAFLVEAERFAVLMPFAVAGLPAGLALFPALGSGVAALLWQPGPVRVLALAAALAASEWLRAVILTGFPWNAYGMLLTGSPWIAQVASLVGMHGLTLVAVAVGAAPVTLFDGRAGRGWRRWVAPLAAAGLLAAAAGHGAHRLETDPVAGEADLRVRIVQPAVPQAEKWRADRADAIFRDLVDLSLAGDGVAPGTLVVWPETALPFLYGGNVLAEAAIDDLLPPGAELMTGAVRLGPRAGSDGRPPIFNGLLLIDHRGRIAATYDKLRLVPFGEYLPLRSVLSRLGLKKVTDGLQDFSPGASAGGIVTADGSRFTPLICYEIIFPALAAPWEGERPRAIVNVTNDAWFGRTPGPYQHFRQAELRAIETGLPVVRAANNGISAVLSASGVAVETLPLDARGIIDRPLPPARAGTPYGRVGDWPANLLAAAFLALALVRRRGGTAGWTT